MEQIDILPVTAVAIVFLQAILWHILMFCYGMTLSSLRRANDLIPETPEVVIYVIVMVMPLAIIQLPLLNYFAMTLMDEMEQLPEQLQGFQIQGSQCFCCSNQHKHPLTGEAMICDRELVYESLAHLYSRAETAETVDALERFNHRVRQKLAPRILQKLRVDLPLRYIVSAVFVSILPIVSEVIWVISQGPKVQLQGMDSAVWCMRLIFVWVQPCLAMVFAFLFSTKLWRLRKLLLFRERTMFLCICLSPIQGMTVGSVWASVVFATFMTEDTSLLPLLPLSVTIVLNVFLHCLDSGG